PPPSLPPTPPHPLLGITSHAVFNDASYCDLLEPLLIRFVRRPQGGSGSASHPPTIHHYPSTIHHQSCASRSLSRSRIAGNVRRRFVLRPYGSPPHAIREPTAGRIWKRMSSINLHPSVILFDVSESGPTQI